MQDAVQRKTANNQDEGYMLNYHNPDDWVIEVHQTTCEHHKRQPWDRAWPGCTCSGGVSQRRATPEERLENIRRREAEQARRSAHMDAYDKANR